MTAATKTRKLVTFRGGDYVADLMAELSRAAICDRIGEAREQSGLTQVEFAELLHVHWRTVQNWESRKKPNVPWDRLDEIAKATDVTRDWLLHGDYIETTDLATGVADLQKQLDEVLRLLRVGYEAPRAEQP